MLLDIDYVVQDGKVLIVDQFTGRIMDGRRYSDGLHQAIEAKEGVEIEDETKTMATITFQNYFRMYKKLAGMTGTAKTEEEEFREIIIFKYTRFPQTVRSSATIVQICFTQHYKASSMLSYKISKIATAKDSLS